MSSYHRLWVVPLSYLASSLIGGLGVLASFEFGIGGDASEAIAHTRDLHPWASFFQIFGLTLRVCMIAAPVALPVIIYAEWKRISSWKYFFIAGLVLSIGFGLLFVGWLSSPSAWLFVLIVVATPILAALTYWLLAWRIFAPAQAIKRAP